MAHKKTTPVSPRLLFFAFLLIAVAVVGAIYNQLAAPRADTLPQCGQIHYPMGGGTVISGTLVSLSSFRGAAGVTRRVINVDYACGNWATYAGPFVGRAVTGSGILYNNDLFITSITGAGATPTPTATTTPGTATPTPGSSATPAPSPTPTTTACRVNVDVTYVAENSITMNSQPMPLPAGLMKDFVTKMQDGLTTNKDRASLVSYTTTAVLQSEYTGTLSSVTNKLGSLTYTGYPADLAKGVNQASQYVRAHPQAGQAKVVVVLTDGRVSNINEAYNVASRDFTDSQIYYYVVNFRQDVAQLHNLAGVGGGLYSMVTSTTQITPTVNNFMEKFRQDFDCQLSGFKFNDLNGNGARDANESGLGGWKIELLKADGSGTYNKVAEATTFSPPASTPSTPTPSVCARPRSVVDASGRFVSMWRAYEVTYGGSITLTNGFYHIKNAPQGYTLADGDGRYIVYPAGNTPETIMVASGNDQAAAQFRAMANGAKYTITYTRANYPADLGLTKVCLQAGHILGNPPIYSDGENPSRTTDQKAGYFAFSNLEAGQYKLREVRQDGWNITTPTAESTVFTLPLRKADIGFGNRQTNPLGLRVSLRADKTVVQQGQLVQLTYDITNPSTQVASQAVIQQPLPTGVVTEGGATSITLTIGDIAANATISRNVNVRYQGH